MFTRLKTKCKLLFLSAIITLTSGETIGQFAGEPRNTGGNLQEVVHKWTTENKKTCPYPPDEVWSSLRRLIQNFEEKLQKNSGKLKYKGRGFNHEINVLKTTVTEDRESGLISYWLTVKNNFGGKSFRWHTFLLEAVGDAATQVTYNGFAYQYDIGALGIVAIQDLLFQELEKLLHEGEKHR